jgi:nucleoid-associated protein YgaU
MAGRLRNLGRTTVRSIPFPVLRLVRCLLLALVSTAVLALGGGCSGNNSAQGDETSDPLYQHARDLKSQERYGEALSAFLREIDRRGESGAPESHLDAALLYLNFVKNPIEAYHHFGKYLELRPNDQKVRGQLEAARREIARALLAPPADQTVQLQTNDELEQLRRRVAELEAENQTLRGGGSFVAAARNPPLISLSDDHAGAPAPTDGESPLSPAPSARPAQSTPAQTSSPFTRPTATAPAASTPTGASRSAAVPNRPATHSVAGRPTAPQRPGATAGGRTYTVQKGDTPYAIARRFYGSADNAKVRAIIEANGDVVRSPADLRPGMVLRIP